MSELPPLPYEGIPLTPRKEPFKPVSGNLGGRKLGSQNKITKTLKDAILLAAETVGDDMASAAAEKGEDRPGGLLGYLKMVATTDIKSFSTLLGRVLPMEVTAAGGGPLEVIFKTVYEETAPKG